MRRWLRQAAERVICGTPLPLLARRRRVGQVLVLAWHNVVPRGESPVGDRSLHIPQAQFAAQLDALLETHDVIALDDLPDTLQRPSDRPRAILTWDDAYLGALTAGVEEVVSRGLSATMFVCPGLLGGQPFWWDVLAAMTGGAVPDQIRRVALMECRGQGQVVLGRFGSGKSTDLPPHARSGSERELSEACARPGITLGVHSWSHPNLSRLSGAELRDELVRPAEWLRERYPRTLTPWLAYPYGLHSREVRESSAAAGFRGGLQVTGGYFRNDGQDWFAAPRLNVAADVSHEGFVLRMAGVLGR